MTSRDVTNSMRLAVKSWLSTAPRVKGRPEVEVLILGGGKNTKSYKRQLVGVTSWQWSELTASKKVVHSLTGKNGMILVVRPWLLGSEEPGGGHGGLLALNAYSRGRDAAGQALAQVFESGARSVRVNFHQCEEDLLHGALVGMDMAAYQFRRVTTGQYPPRLGLLLLANNRKIEESILSQAEQLACSINFARHLTNLPPNALNPVSFAAVIKDHFSRGRKCTLDIWGTAKLKTENMNLLLAVGASSDVPPQMVRIRYRPKQKKTTAPIAFVGKGITFDTGGVNLKPDAGMRWMKKDMGGAATVAALAYWVSRVNHPHPCDFYLALAENSIGTGSFRPGDVITSRSGKTVEIHNTDAEGRLVLADVMDVAVETKPQLLVDVATLTGAIKAGLGTAIAGLFGNDDKSLLDLAQAGQQRGDWLWPMPLFRKYKTALKSNAADLVNAGDGFGGAITAALFLENFTANVPWLHLDIYAWKDGADGALSESGGNGQAVQALTYWLQHRTNIPRP